jgi:polysaccharide deacetylase family protein (PEP-CTERM system associated)
MSVAAERPTHCLSFDVEEHFQVSAFWSDERRQQWDQYESRVGENTRRLAELLAKHETRATFFVLGWVAERHPDLVKSLVAQGHEIASHGYGHELVTTQSPALFRQDVRKSKNILEDLIGSSVVGYRAPSFSITSDNSWALSILVEEGYQYDSSIYERFNRTGASRHCAGRFEIATPGGSLWEVPPSTLRVAGFHIPVAGGGYFRLFPYIVSKNLLRRLESHGDTLVMYLHPWEIDSQQPRMEGPWLSQARHYMNLDRTESRLAALVEDFRFGTIAQFLARPGGLDLQESAPISQRRVVVSATRG